MESARRRLMAEEAAALSSATAPASIDLTKSDGEGDDPRRSQSVTSASSSSASSSYTATMSGTPGPSGSKYKMDNRPKTKMLYIPPRAAQPAGFPPTGPMPPFAKIETKQSPPPGAWSAAAAPQPHDLGPYSSSTREIDEAAAAMGDVHRGLGQTPLAALEGLLAQDLEVDYDAEDAEIKGMTVTLKPYQVQGVKWMQQRESGRHKGGILADDMGLGKTIQTLALIVSNHPKNENATVNYIVKEADVVKAKAQKKKKTLAEQGEVDDQKDDSKEIPREKVEVKSRTTLIIAPVAVMKQWESEIRNRSDAGLKVMIHHGATKASNAAKFKSFDVVITSYNTAAAELDDKDPILLRMRWLRVVLDEAHTIKNHSTKAAQACFAMSERAHSKWCLTGTPIQNTALDFFSLIHFLDIPPFNDLRHFKDKIAKPIASANQNSVNWGMKRLLVVTNAILLRRQKDALFEGKPLITLPKRTVETVAEPFDNDAEREFYASWEAKAKKNAEEQQDSYIGMLVILLRLRQAADHPFLITRKVDVEDIAPPVPKKRAVTADSAQVAAEVDPLDELADLLSSTALTTVSCQRCHAQIKLKPGDQAPEMCDECVEAVKTSRIDWTAEGSTKIRMMLKVLKQIRESGDEKTIVFSQFTTFMDLIGYALDADGYEHVRYDGSMTSTERAVVLQKFAEKPSIKVAVMSLKAAAVGINVTCASRVIFTDVWWNPTTQDQAIDRAHRMGQTRDVTAYVLAISGSVEERIIALQEKKRALASAALEGTKLKKGSTKLSKEELNYLFNGGRI